MFRSRIFWTSWSACCFREFNVWQHVVRTRHLMKAKENKFETLWKHCENTCWVYKIRLLQYIKIVFMIQEGLALVITWVWKNLTTKRRDYDLLWNDTQGILSVAMVSVTKGLKIQVAWPYSPHQVGKFAWHFLSI